jgi:hypothetical protein
MFMVLEQSQDDDNDQDEDEQAADSTNEHVSLLFGESVG